MNASTWREAVLAVNGFDLELEYGGLDREFGQRLENLGCRGVQVRHRAVLLHLHHDRPPTGTPPSPPASAHSGMS